MLLVSRRQIITVQTIRSQLIGRLSGSLLSFLKTLKMLDHVYLRHLSTEYRSILSADMSTDSRSICRPSIGRYVGRHVGRVSVDMLFELIDCRSTLSVGMSVDTRPASRPICRWCIGRLSVVYRSTVVAIGVLLTVVLLK